MVMLFLMAQKYSQDELVVATFDHGTRESSKADAEFVSQIASALQLKIYRGEARLGVKTSEEKAREKRYAFLRDVAEKEGGEIYTAHHLDDLVETVAINLTRGTGMRGLAALNAPNVKRPFLDGTFGKVFDKCEILSVASENEIVFRQDPTNASDEYLRNRIRNKTIDLPKKTKLKIFELWQEQVKLIREIDKTVDGIIPEDLVFEREWFKKMGENEALEILRAALARADVSATRPQIREFLKAICSYQPGKKFNLPEDRLVKLSKKDFRL